MDDAPYAPPLPELLASLERSKADIAAGRVVPVEDVIRRLRETSARMRDEQDQAPLPRLVL